MELAMFVHVLGAMALVGTLVLAAVAMAGHNLRLAHRTLLIGVIPSWIVMRVSAQWNFTEGGWDELEPEPDWIGIGFAVSESSFLLLVAATVCAGIAARRARGSGLRTATLVLVGIALAAYVVTIWAMTTKPS
jgi:hypothetical protein